MISGITSILRFIVRGFLVAGFMLFFLIPWLMRVKYYRRIVTAEGQQKADMIAVSLANRLVWLFGIRVQASGTPAQGAVLFAANHISWLDISVLHSTCGMGFVGKAEINKWPLFGFIARTGGTIFHQRGSHDSAADVSALMAQRLQSGRAVTIFPEGGIKPGSNVRVFHARMFRPAVDVGCVVQPVMIRYMRDGQRDHDVSFRQGENMLVNYLRQLARPASVAEVHFLGVIDATDQPRRLLAESARAAVIASIES
jgi:1-acyl-sn-glycerol-3-phosphate acyltransferase